MVDKATTKSSRIRVLIGDRQPIFRSGLNQLLSKEPGITVVGEAETGEQALQLTEECKPTILVLDSLLIEAQSSGIIDELQEKYKNLRVILLTPTERDDTAGTFRAKVVGIVPKQASVATLIECIHRTDSGEAWAEVPPASGPTRQSQGMPASAKAPKDNSPLSVREREVVGLVSQGFRNKEIAGRMFISEQTVKNHLHNIFDKLGVSDRLELALYAIHKNLQAVP